MRFSLSLAVLSLAACDFEEIELDFNQPLAFSNLDGEELDAEVGSTRAVGTFMGDEALVLDERAFASSLDCSREVPMVEMTHVDEDGSEFRLSFQQDGEVGGGLLHHTVDGEHVIYAFASGSVALVVSDDCTTASGVFSGLYEDELIEGSFIVGE